ARRDPVGRRRRGGDHRAFDRPLGLEADVVIRRIFALLAILWMLGFLWFAIALPQPAGAEKTDAIVVPTGSGGRIPRGLALLRQDAAERMLVTGVGAEVKPREFAAEYDVPATLMDCCITLGFSA